MQIVEITDEDILDIYCPFCGKHSLTQEGVKEPCKHLQWIDSSETLGDAWYQSETFLDLTDELEDQNLLDTLERHFPKDSTVMFFLGGAFPGDAEVYIIYQSTASLSTKDNQTVMM